MNIFKTLKQQAGFDHSYFDGSPVVTTVLLGERAIPVTDREAAKRGYFRENTVSIPGGIQVTYRKH